MPWTGMMGAPTDDPGAHDHDAAVQRFLTRATVAALLDVSPTTVTRWAREGRLPCRKTLGGHHRFDPAVIAQVRELMKRSEGLQPPVIDSVETDDKTTPPDKR